MARWRDAVRSWAFDHEVKYPSVEEVSEATTWSWGLPPAAEVECLVRYVEWARRVFPACPPCPYVSPSALALLPLDVA